MAISKLRPKRKISGGRYIDYRKKKSRDLGRQPSFTKIGEVKSREIKTRSGNHKFSLLSVNIVNVYDKKTKKYVKAKIQTIVENTANRHFIRRNILTKGAVIETDKGKARVTNRPGQENSVNAVLI